MFIFNGMHGRSIRLMDVSYWQSIKAISLRIVFT
jgi:hypothetical protein